MKLKKRTQKKKYVRWMPKSPGRTPDGMDSKLTETRLGADRRRDLKQRAAYETASNRLRGIKTRVYVNDLMVRAVDEMLAKYPPRPEDAITAAMEQVAVVER